VADDANEAGNEVETFSRPDRIALVAGGVWSRLISQLNEVRELLEAAADRDRRSSSRPSDLQILGRGLGGETRRRLERAAEAAATKAEGDLDLVFAGDDGHASGQPSGKNRHPPAPEQLLLLAMIGIGPSRLREVIGTLLVECDNDSDAVRYALRYLQWKRRDSLTTIAGRALLPIIVADFEELLAAVVRLWLTLYPEALGVDRHQVTVGLVRTYKSIDDILRLAIDEKVEDFMNTNPEDWRRALADKLDIDRVKLTSDWPAILEMFARRHAIVHAGGLVDDRYLKRLPPGASATTIGTPLFTGRAYISAAIDRSEQLATGLVVAWLADFLPAGGSHVPEIASDPVLRALEQRRWQDVANLAEIALGGFDADHSHHELRVNLWMARRGLGDNWDTLPAEIEGWTPPKAEPRYLVAKAALLRDEIGLLNALRDYDAHGLSVRDLAARPRIVHMRERSPTSSSARRPNERQARQQTISRTPTTQAPLTQLVVRPSWDHQMAIYHLRVTNFNGLIEFRGRTARKAS
jgi:hypothetical protein